MAGLEYSELNGGNSSINISKILDILEQLNDQEIKLLYRKLGIAHDTELQDILYPDHRRMPSYEQRMQEFPNYRLHKNLLLYLPPILIILGTFGNIFSFIILKRKAMLKFSTYYYLMVLAVADTLVLYIGLLRLWIGELTGFDIREQSDWLCKLTMMVGYTVSDLSVWLIIAVTCERYIVVCHPLKANLMCNTRRARLVILIVGVVLFLINMHFFWSVSIKYYSFKGERLAQCEGSANLVDAIWPWMDMLVYSFLPFVIILVLNGLIIRQVIRARRHRNELRSGSMREGRRPSYEGNTRLTVMLLTISFAFLLTTLPMNIISISAVYWNRKNLKQTSDFYLVRSITEMLMYVNHSMNFFLYCATGQKFRHQLIWMVCYARHTYHLPWGSDQSQGSRMEVSSFRNTKGKKREILDICASLPQDMYIPVNSNGKDGSELTRE